MTGWQRILFAGVGGQGVMSAGRWVGDAAHLCGLAVAMRQVHGLSQRGGSVTTSVVIGGARSAAIADGMADALVALEPMEGARALAKVSGKTVVLLNTRPLLPASLQSAGRPYPPLSSLLGPIQEVASAVVALDACSLAEEAGSHRSLNVVMLGMLAGSGLLPVPAPRLLDVVLGAGIRAFQEVNRRAFELGARAVAGDHRLAAATGERS